MRYRSVILQDRTTYTSDTTEIIDINLATPITSLVVQLEVTNGGTTPTAHPVACLTKAEIVDGSEVLWSVDGYELEAADWYNNGGRFRSNYNAQLNGSTMLRAIGLHFGRYPFDELLAFDPVRYKNPQLKLTLDINAGGATVSTNYLTVYANCFDELVPSLRGFLGLKEVKEWTAAASTIEYTDLPTDFPYRALYLRAFLAGTEPNQAISDVKITEDRDARVPVNLEAQEIERVLCEMYGPVEEHYYFATATSKRYLYVAPTTRVVATAMIWDATGGSNNHGLYNGDGGRLDTITTSAGKNVQILVRGWVPHAVYRIPFGKADMIEDWYDVSRINDLQAQVTGASTPVCNLVVEQFRPY